MDPLGLRGDVTDFLQTCTRTSVSVATRVGGGIALFLVPAPNPGGRCSDLNPRPECPDDCARIEAEIAGVAAELRERYLRALRDPKDLYNLARTIPFARRAGSWVGHRQRFMNLQVKLQSLIAAADAKGCRVSPDDRLLATAPYPDTPLPR